MKKKTKIISSLALALVLGLGTAGCSLDKEKTNALMEKVFIILVGIINLKSGKYTINR